MRYSYHGLHIAMIVLLEVCEVLSQSGEWTQWSHWSGCSVTCGYGVYKRQRTWERHDGTKTKEPFVYEDIVECINQKSCPLDGGWGYWGTWAECTTMCGGGTTTRKRTCNNPTPTSGGKPCKGKDFATTTCNDWECPELPPNFDIRQCNETTYMCLSELQCVPSIERCDNKLHCHDGSDEHDCYYEEYWRNGARTSFGPFVWTILTTVTVIFLFGTS